MRTVDLFRQNNSTELHTADGQYFRVESNENCPTDKVHNYDIKIDPSSKWK